MKHIPKMRKDRSMLTPMREDDLKILATPPKPRKILGVKLVFNKEISY